MHYPGFIYGSSEQQSIMADVQRTINLYPEKVESGAGKNQFVLIGTPGLTFHTTAGSGPIRAIGNLVTNETFSGTPRDCMHVVSGNAFYSVAVDGTGTVASRGTVADDSTHSKAYIAEAPNGKFLIVSAGTAYSYDASTLTLAAVTGLGGKTCAGAALVDGFFITVVPSERAFYISALFDPTSFGALDFGSTESILGSPIICLAAFESLWIFSNLNGQVYFDSGDALFPFSRVAGAHMGIGAYSADSVCYFDNSVVWLGFDPNGGGIVWQARNYLPQRVSNHALENACYNAIQTYGFTALSTAIGFTYQLKGHSFYVLTFPVADMTWVYDASTGVWHEWLSWDGAAFHKHVLRSHAFSGGANWGGSGTDGKIYILNLDKYTDDGTAIRRLRRAPHLVDEMHLFTYHNFQLDMEVGLGSGSSNPTADLRWSNDGGKTWSTAVSAGIGDATGPALKTRVLWRRLGSARDRVFEVSTTAAVKQCWTDAYINNLGV